MAVMFPGPQRSVPRPGFSRQRSNSVPIFSLANVSDEEAGILFSAAEQATARRRRPVSVDSPGHTVNIGQNLDFSPKRTFNFSTPSRFGIGKSPLRHTVTSGTFTEVGYDHQQEEELEGQLEAQVLEDEEEETPSYKVELAPIPPRRLLTPAPIVYVRSSSDGSPLSSPNPTSPRRQVANQNLKAYADGLLRFTQARLITVAPPPVLVTGDMSESSVPPTPELEQDVMELRFERPTLRSHFSNWSSTTEDTAEYDTVSRHLSFASSMEPRTPDLESGMISPDSFFNEVTPRVRQTAASMGMSSARPSSQFFTSQAGTSSAAMNITSEPFSYFAGFDSASAAATSSQYSSQYSAFDFEVLSNPPTPSRPQSRSRPASSASNSVPFTRRRPHTPYGEAMGISRPPSWLVRANC